MRRTTALMSEYHADTKSGESLHFELCKGGYFSNKEQYSLKVIGKNVQASENAENIQCIEKDSKIYVSGKNILDDKLLVFSGGLSTKQTFKFPAGSTYTFSFDTKNIGVTVWGSVRGCFPFRPSITLDGTRKIITRTFTEDTLSQPIDWNKTCSMLNMDDGSIKLNPEDITNCQIELNSTATEYEPYSCNFISTPCDLYEGDIWYPITGKVQRKHGDIEQYDPQPIFAPSGIVNVIQQPFDLSVGLEQKSLADLSATMLKLKA